MLSQVTGKSYNGSHLQRGRSIGSWKLCTAQRKLDGLQATGVPYGWVSKTSLGNEWVVM